MSTLAQNVPGSPVQTTGGGGFWTGVTGFLNGALDTYAQYELIRARQNPENVYLVRTNVPELPTGNVAVVNGATGVNPGQMQPAHFNVAGMAVPKAIGYGVLAVLGLVVLKKAKIL